MTISESVFRCQTAAVAETIFKNFPFFLKISRLTRIYLQCLQGSGNTVAFLQTASGAEMKLTWTKHFFFPTSSNLALGSIPGSLSLPHWVGTAMHDRSICDTFSNHWLMGAIPPWDQKYTKQHCTPHCYRQRSKPVSSELNQHNSINPSHTTSWQKPTKWYLSGHISANCSTWLKPTWTVYNIYFLISCLVGCHGAAVSWVFGKSAKNRLFCWYQFSLLLKLSMMTVEHTLTIGRVR